MASSPQNGLLVASIDVLIDGTPVSAAVLRYVEEVVVDESVELPGMFAFAVTSAETLDSQPAWIDDDIFSVGKSVEIRMGGSQQMESLIKGEITALEPEFVVSRLPLLRVRGYDRRHRLQRGRKTRTFLQTKDSDIASKIGGEAGLTVTAEDTAVQLDQVFQANRTDWDFLCERARLLHYEVVVDDKTLLFRPTPADKSPKLVLGMQNDLLEFYPRLSSSGQVTGVNVQGWDMKNKSALSAKSQAGDEVSKMGGQSTGAAIVGAAFDDAVEVVSDQPVTVQAEADKLAKARFNHLALELISGEGVCRGNTGLHAGTVINIDGLGKRFSGSYYVTSAIHRYSPGSGYLTEFTVRRSAS